MATKKYRKRKKNRHGDGPIMTVTIQPGEVPSDADLDAEGFGGPVPPGTVDRRSVARIVFVRPVERERLESLVHPWIENRRQAMFRTAPDDVPALVIDAALLIEVGVDRQCDALIFVQADRSRRLARLAEKRGWSEQEMNQREESQLPLDAKRIRADYVIDNNGDLLSLAGQVRRTLREIVQSHRR